MAVFLGNIDRGLEHHHTERDARNPGDEANEDKDGEDKEYNASAPVLAREHVDRSREAEDCENVSNSLCGPRALQGA